MRKRDANLLSTKRREQNKRWNFVGIPERNGQGAKDGKMTMRNKPTYSERGGGAAKDSTRDAGKKGHWARRTEEQKKNKAEEE